MRKVYSINARKHPFLSFAIEPTIIPKGEYLGDFVLNGNNCELARVYHKISQPNPYEKYILMDVTSSPTIKGWEMETHYEDNPIEYEKYFAKVLKPGRQYWWIPSNTVKVTDLMETE